MIVKFRNLNEPHDDVYVDLSAVTLIVDNRHEGKPNFCIAMGDTRVFVAADNIDYEQLITEWKIAKGKTSIYAKVRPPIVKE